MLAVYAERSLPRNLSASGPGLEEETVFIPRAVPTRSWVGPTVLVGQASKLDNKKVILFIQTVYELAEQLGELEQ